MKLTAEQISILCVLAPDRCLTISQVSAQSGAYGRLGRRIDIQSAWVRSDLLALLANGLVSTLDDQNPVCWIITEAGLVALAAATENTNVL